MSHWCEQSEQRGNIHIIFLSFSSWGRRLFGIRMGCWWFRWRNAPTLDMQAWTVNDRSLHFIWTVNFDSIRFRARGNYQTGVLGRGGARSEKGVRSLTYFWLTIHSLYTIKNQFPEEVDNRHLKDTLSCCLKCAECEKGFAAVPLSVPCNQTPSTRGLFLGDGVWV